VTSEADTRGFAAACARDGWVFDEQLTYRVAMSALLFGLIIVLPPLVGASGRDGRSIAITAFAVGGGIPVLLGVIVPLVLRRALRTRVEADVAAERARLAALPFAVENVERTYALADPGIVLRVSFEDGAPDAALEKVTERIAPIARAVIDVKDGALRIRVEDCGARHGSRWRRGRALREALHRITNGALVPTHAERKITRVALG
jgi:hypothetical protein